MKWTLGGIVFLTKQAIVDRLQTKKPSEINLKAFCGISWNRTSDTRIFSPLLYRLSYDTALLGLQM